MHLPLLSVLQHVQPPVHPHPGPKEDAHERGTMVPRKGGVKGLPTYCPCLSLGRVRSRALHLL